MSEMHFIRTYRIKAKTWVTAAIWLAIVLLHNTASADVCAEIELSKDTLSESDRASVQVLFERALEQEKQHVVATGCTATWRVYHLKLGSSVTVVMTSPTSSRTMKVLVIDDIPEAYSQMVRSLISGKPLVTGMGNNIDRSNVTIGQAAPRRVIADSLLYLRLGYAGIVARSVQTGPSLGLGWRYEIDQIGVDLSILNFVIPKTGDNDQSGICGSFIKLMGLYYFNALGDSTPYLGAGVSYGGVIVGYKDDKYSETGLQGEASAGYEFLRSSTIRLFVQFDTTWPFYLATTEHLSFNSSDQKRSAYTPFFALSFGIGI
jgi:hypothetical protein